MRTWHFPAVISIGLFLTTLARSDQPKLSGDLELSEVASKLLGKWEGPGCAGVFEFAKDKSFQVKHWGPGNAEFKGTWAVTKVGATLRLRLTHDDEYERKPMEFDVVKLDRSEMVLGFSGDGRNTYERAKK